MRKQCIDETANLAGVYKDIANCIDYETAEKIHYMFKGQQVSFPIRFFDADYVKKDIICRFCNGESVKELAVRYGYSERRIRQIIKEN